jgi:beta-lactamase regulating signal transducer with metallopeptidase domain
MDTIMPDAFLHQVASAWLPLAIDVAVKGAALLLVAWLATSALRRHSAAARHLVWFLALVGLLAVPLLSATLPAWNVLPDWRPASGKAFLPPALPAPATVSPQISPDPDFVVTAALNPSVAELPPISRTVATGLPLLLIAIWAAGALLCLAPLGLAAFSLRRLSRSAARSNDPSTAQLLRQLAGRLGLIRPVTVLESDRRTMPMIWGITRHTLVLPAESRHWSSDRLRAVLLHELAHAARGDCLVQLLGRLAMAAHWFNPLAWLAFRRLQAEAELACDDVVLRGGHRPSDYATHVLELASGTDAKLCAASGSIALASPNGLEGRVRAILDDRRSRRNLTALIAIVLAAAIAGVAIVISCLHSGPSDQVVEPAAGVSAEPAKSDVKVVKSRAAVKPKPGPVEQPDMEPSENEPPANEALSNLAATEMAPAAPSEPAKPPTTRQEWIARLGDQNPHSFNWGSGTTDAVWRRAGLTDDQARAILALEDQMAPLWKSTGDAHHAIQQPLMEKTNAYLAQELEARAAGREEEFLQDKELVRQAQAASQAYRDSRTKMWQAYGELEQKYYEGLGGILTPEQLQKVPPPQRLGP